MPTATAVKEQSVVVGSAAVVGAGSGAAAATLGSANDATAAAIAGIATVGTMLVVWLPASYFLGWRKYSRRISELKESNEYERTTALPRSQPATEVDTSVGKATTVFSRWSQSSLSLRQATLRLRESNFSVHRIVYGRTSLDREHQLQSVALFEELDQIPESAPAPSELDWTSTQLLVRVTQGPSVDGWTSTSGFDQYVVQQIVLIVCLRDPSDLSRTIIGVSSPVSSLTEAVLESLAERLAMRPLNPNLLLLDPRNLGSTGLSVRSLRYFTENTHVLERYSEPDLDLILRRLRLSDSPGGIQRIEGMTVAAGNVSLNVFDDGQVYLHNVDLDDVPMMMSRLLVHIRNGLDQ